MSLSFYTENNTFGVENEMKKITVAIKHLNARTIKDEKQYCSLTHEIYNNVLVKIQTGRISMEV